MGGGYTRPMDASVSCHTSPHPPTSRLANTHANTHAYPTHPQVITMGGGYTRPMDASVSCHTDVYRTAAYRLAAWHRHSGSRGRAAGQAGQGQRIAVQ